MHGMEMLSHTFCLATKPHPTSPHLCVDHRCLPSPPPQITTITAASSQWQISDVLCNAGKPCGLQSVCLYGGTSKGPQVLDETDRMLDMGFEPEVRSILSQTCSGMLYHLISFFYCLFFFFFLLVFCITYFSSFCLFILLLFLFN
ncbi:hypothetical protein HYC85_023948 [Camellia sinensis]|uniref:DEAD-box RNA helicase Q domain-containing protein n=1 Tax=Camellia sinensis TaxID=4442 RepID=A0A7J7GFY8_CAMSI|nr:hypothetical protein HYC85_023948 [Camellia sinensis]